MAYKALYREWRPQNFNELIGQDHVSRTLQNAVKSGRIAHAYLFSGPRGTGKTSSAKILAKMLNCEHGPTPNPCNECDPCKRINSGTSLDVIEIDAASNRGIDEIRDLREKVKFLPGEDRYKVYIIDEVHMLTSEAFNALLKTLEEPPSRVVFILATTEQHKIPATILSRVQRFEFKRIGIGDIVDRLKVVTDSLGGEVDEDALLLIARKAEGGMRDALSLLDQCYIPGESLTPERVLSVLGSVSEEEMYNFCELLLQKDTLGVISSLDKFLIDGKDPGQIVKEAIEYLRNLLIIKSVGEAKGLIYVARDFWPKLMEQSSRVDVHRLHELIQLFIKTDGDLRFSTQPRVSLEIALIGATAPQTGSFVQQPQESQQIAGSSMPPVNRPHSEVAKGAQSTEKGKTKVDAAIKPGDSTLAGSFPADISQIKSEWKKVLDIVKKTRIAAHALLVEGHPLAIQDGILTIAFKEQHSFHKEKIEQPENKKVVEQALNSVFGYPLGLKCVLNGENGGNTANDDDLVMKTYELFGEEFVEVKD